MVWLLFYMSDGAGAALLADGLGNLNMMLPWLQVVNGADVGT